MSGAAGKTFSGASSVDLNAVNNAQKAIFSEMVRQSGTDLLRQRQQAYLARWKEALVYVKTGDRLLDIGAGWPVTEVHDLIIDEMKIDYVCVDVDPSIVADTQQALERKGLAGIRAKLGTNSRLEFDDQTFDFVFSSHCLEHSDDMAETFSEIARVLKGDGTLFFSVPIGFDDSDEHLLYLDSEEWQSVVTMAGFDIVNLHFGKTYPMAGWDLSLVARKIGPADVTTIRQFMSGKTKFGKTMVLPSHDIFRYSSEIVSGQHVILDAPDSEAVVSADNLQDLLFLCHDWSGFAEISYSGGRKLVDLYSRISEIKAIDMRGITSPISIKPIGQSAGKAAQVVLFGALLK